MADLMTIQEVAMDALCGDELPSTRRYVRADLYMKLEAELAAARERIGALEGSLYELHRIVVGHQDTQGFTGRPRGSHVSWFVRNDVAWRIRDLTEDPNAAPTSAAHTGEGGMRE